MATCKACQKTYGFLELSDGICKSCINNQKPPCHSCAKNFQPEDLIDGYCKPCYERHLTKKDAERKANEMARKEVEAKQLSERQLDSIILTTEGSPNLEILERIEIITAECAFGMNLFKDFFAGVRDVVGGRSNATQGVLRDARKTVLDELKKEAHSVGANAVVGVDLDYSEFSGGGKSMLFVVASGTAVIVKRKKPIQDDQ